MIKNIGLDNKYIKTFLFLIQDKFLRRIQMKVKDLIQQLCNMDMEADVVLEVYNHYSDYKFASSEDITDVRMISNEKCLIEGA